MVHPSPFLEIFFSFIYSPMSHFRGLWGRHVHRARRMMGRESLCPHCPEPVTLTLRSVSAGKRTRRHPAPVYMLGRNKGYHTRNRHVSLTYIRDISDALGVAWRRSCPSAWNHSTYFENYKRGVGYQRRQLKISTTTITLNKSALSNL